MHRGMYSPAADPNIQVLLDRIVPALNPQAVYLFGSRARGEARADSDYDLFLVVDDDTPRAQLQIQALSALKRGTGITADLIPCRRRIYQEYQDELGAISYAVKREGQMVYARSGA